MQTMYDFVGLVPTYGQRTVLVMAMMVVDSVLCPSKRARHRMTSYHLTSPASETDGNDSAKARRASRWILVDVVSLVPQDCTGRVDIDISPMTLNVLPICIARALVGTETRNMAGRRIIQ